MDAKRVLASTITAQYHGTVAAERAAAEFARVHQQREVPEDVGDRRVAAPGGRVRLTRVLAATEMVSSNTEGRRMIEQGAVELDGARVSTVDLELESGRTYLVRVGKRRFCRVTIDD